MKSKKIINREGRRRRVRAKINGTAKRPRLIMHRSLRHNWAQLINDENGMVIVSATDKTLKLKGNKSERAKEIGKLIAKKAVEKGIKTCVFDRAGYKYHGRVKALADGAREAGLVF